MAKAKIIATFSNGETDEYKGIRDIKAAWQVTHPDGATSTGHSLDRARAEKTARNHAASCCEGVGTCINTKWATPNYLRYVNGLLKDAGVKTVREYNEQIKAKRAAYVAQCKIEIVDVAAR